LVDILAEVDRSRTWLKRGHSSLFVYVVDELRLSPNVAYTLIAVMRKAREVPALGRLVREGRITMSNARRVASVLTKENQAEWLPKAVQLSQRALEKELVREKPALETPERVTLTSGDRVRLQVGLSAREMEKLRRVQDLLSQKRRCNVSLEECLGELAGEWLERHDPLRRAKRVRLRKGIPAGGIAPAEVAEGGARQPAEELSRDSDEGVALQPAGIAGRDSAEDLTPGPAKDAISGSAKVPSSPPSKSVDLLVSRQKNSLRSADGANGAKDTDNAYRSDGGEEGDGAEEGDGGEESNPGRANSAEPSPPRPPSQTRNPGRANLAKKEPPRQLRSAGRPPLPAKVRHAVYLRDHARCTHFDPQGRRCTSKRFLEIHHILPRAQGGGDSAENLTRPATPRTPRTIHTRAAKPAMPETSTMAR
jgi:hypothetical protein